MDNLHEQSFNKEMIRLYKKIKTEAKYNASKFFKLVTEVGGLDAVKELIMSAAGEEDCAILWEKGRLDLTIEATALQPRWQPLFNEEELEAAESRLRKYGFVK